MSRRIKVHNILAGICCLCLFVSATFAKGKPGGGGNDGGAEPPANLAFVFANLDDGGLFLTTSDGMTTARLTKPPKWHEDSFPLWSPDLDADVTNGYQGEIAFIRTDTRSADARLYVVAADGSGETLVHDFGGGVSELGLTWSPDGRYLVYVANFNARFIDVLTGEVTEFTFPTQAFGASFSIDLALELEGYQGYLASVQSSADGADIVLRDVEIDTGGNITLGGLTVLDLPFHQEDPHFSPTGLSIVFTSEEPVDAQTTDANVGVIDIGFDADGFPIAIDGEILMERIGTFPSGYTWSPDGLHVAWDSPFGARGSFEIVQIRSDGSDNGVPTLVTDSSRVNEFSPDWKPDWNNDIDSP